MKRNWLEALKEKMKNHEQSPPLEIWQNIESELFNQYPTQKTPIPIEDGLEKRGLFRRLQSYSIAASLAGLVLVGTALYFILRPGFSPTDQNSIVNQKPHKAQEPSAKSPSKVWGKQSSQELERFAQDLEGVQPLEKMHMQLGLKPSELNSLVAEFSHPWNVDLVSSRKVLVVQPVQNQGPINPEGNPLKILQMPGVESKTSRLFDKLRFGPNAGQLASNSSAQDPGYLTMSGGSAARTVLQQLDAPYSSVVMGNSNQEASSEVSHQMPISYGLAVQYPLNSKWSLSSGVSYTNLRSNLKAGTETNYWKSRQTLHYIGVPLQVNYKISEQTKLSTYAYAGGEVKKVIAASTKTSYVVQSEPTTYATEKIRERPVQVSLNSGIGLEYRLHKNISLYVEPGIEYHLKDNSGIQTLYKDRPLTFSLRSGLRLSISKQ